MKGSAKIWIIAVFFALAPVWISPAHSAGGVSIIVNVANSVSNLTPDQIADYFMKKTRRWADGTPVRFFDHRDDSEVRNEFLDDVLGKTAREMDLYWIGQKLYSGSSAPTQVPSDSMMVALVSRFPGAIGYVSADYSPGVRVKKIEIRGKR
jgi:ABC-type phosphate transport system substrate-binding protein